MKLAPQSLTRSFSVLFALTLLTTPLAYAEQSNSFGVGASYESGVYYGQDGYVEPYPMIDAEFGDFFIDNKVVGWTGYKRENIEVALIVSQNDHFLDVNDINEESQHIFVGIENRDRAVEAGFLYTYFSPVGDISWEYYKDVSNTHGGMHNIVRLARPSGNPNLVTITPSIFVHYFSSAFNDYYYGIDAAENAQGLAIVQQTRPDIDAVEFEEFRPAFKGENSGHLGIDIWIKKAYTPNLIGVAYAAWEEVLGEVNNSSLVEDDARYTFRLGIEYRL